MPKSSITTESITTEEPDMNPVNGLRPIHPGEILREEFLVPLGLSANAVALALRVPAPRINDIVRERRAISADTALRLARHFGTSAEFWLGLQSDYDMRVAQIENGERIAQEVIPREQAAYNPRPPNAQSCAPPGFIPGVSRARSAPASSARANATASASPSPKNSPCSKPKPASACARSAGQAARGIELLDKAAGQ
jgi:addiction module HigA family antidote